MSTMILYQNTPRERGRLFGQYGGAGVIAVRKHKIRFQRKRPKRRRHQKRVQKDVVKQVAKQVAQHVHNHGEKRVEKKHRIRKNRRGAKRARRVKSDKPAISSLVEEGKSLIQQGMKRVGRRAGKALPTQMVASDVVAPAVMKLGSKAVKATRKRFSPDENSLDPAQFPVGVPTRPKIKARRRVSAQKSAHQFVQGMRVKRGGGLFF